MATGGPEMLSGRLKEAIEEAEAADVLVGKAAVSVDVEGFRVQADVRASCPVGCRVRSLEVERLEPAALDEDGASAGGAGRRADRRRSAPGPGGRPGARGGPARSDPADMSDRTWLELNLEGGRRARLHRLRTTLRRPGGCHGHSIHLGVSGARRGGSGAGSRGR